MKKQETAAQIDEKIKILTRKLTAHISTWYEKASDAQKTEIWKKLEDFEAAVIAYRSYEIPWDGQVIDVIGAVGEVRFKTKAFSTFDSIMDKARQLYVQAVTA